MIVIDVNVLVYSLVVGQQTEAARQVFEADPEWIAPSMLLYEFLNILATWERKEIMKAADCQKIWQRAEKLIAGNLMDADPNATLKLAMRHKITAYDAQFVQIALSRNLMLVTEDKELLRKFGETAISMEKFAHTI